MTELEGAQADSPAPPGDAFTVFLASLRLPILHRAAKTAPLPFRFQAGRRKSPAAGGQPGLALAAGTTCAVRWWPTRQPVSESDTLRWSWTLAPGETRALIVKIPYLVLTEKAEHAALAALDFDRERTAVAGYWRRRLDESARLITPEPMLNEFYRAHADAPADQLRARAGQRPALCARRLLRLRRLRQRIVHDGRGPGPPRLSQGGAGMPGRLAALPGHGRLAGRFLHQGGRPLRRGRLRSGRLQPASRLDSLDAGRALPLHARRRVAAARGAGHPGGRGLDHQRNRAHRRTATNWSAACCPPAAWKTSATGGRGSRPVATPGAASTPPPGRWNRSSIPKPRASRKEADAYHRNLLANFRKASDRSPVVRLRDGTAVPHIPSHGPPARPLLRLDLRDARRLAAPAHHRRARPALAGSRLGS